MPLTEIRQLTAHTRLGLWRMDEPFEGTARQRERHTAALLLTAMTGDPSLTIGHESSGKPYITPSSERSSLTSPHISEQGSPILSLSITHTRGWLAMLLSDGEEAVGIDIERLSDRVERIASRFIRPDEAVATTNEKLLLWSAKEAVYKLFSEDNLLFHDMRLIAIHEHHVQMENVRRQVVVDVAYEFTADYVLTYVCRPAVQQPQ